MRSVIGLLILVAFARPLLAAAPTTAPVETIETLIQHLEDSDPTTRQQASNALKAKGYRARVALVKAARSPSPQISSQATELLMPLPWWMLRDPQEVRDVLAHYGIDENGQPNDNSHRMDAINGLSGKPGGPAAMLRLMNEDPSDAVSWWAFFNLRLTEDADVSRTVAKTDLADACVQMVTLAALVALPTDHAGGMKLFKRAIDDDEEGTEYLDVAYRLLAYDAIQLGDKKQAAALWRIRARQLGADSTLADPAFELFAFYADHGLLSDFTNDAQEFSSSLGRPETMYALSRIERLRDGGSNLIADAIAYSARFASSADAASHARVAKLCADHAWNSEARHEAFQLLSSPPDDEVQNGFLMHSILGEIAEIEENHLATAEHEEAQIEILRKSAGNGSELSDENPLLVEANANRLHAAMEAGDTAKAAAYLNKLIDLPTSDSGCTIEVVAALNAQGKKTEAKSFFDRAYAAASAAIPVAVIPSSEMGRAMALNNIAWMCACCKQHTNEGVAFALRAVAMEPENYAYLDTAATAYFAAGKPDEAVRLEKQALVMRPYDPFLLRQLNQFEKGDSRPPSRDPAKKD